MDQACSDGLANAPKFRALGVSSTPPRTVARALLRRLALALAAIARPLHGGIEHGGNFRRQRAVRRGVARGIGRLAISLRQFQLAETVGAIGGGFVGETFALRRLRRIAGGGGAGQAA